MAVGIGVGTVYIDVEPDVSKFGKRVSKGLEHDQGAIAKAAGKIGDLISGKLGIGRQRSEIDNLSKEIATSMSSAGHSMRGFSKDTDRVSVSLDHVGSKSASFNQRMLAMRNILKLLKIPAAFAALGPAIGGLTALAGGAFAVISALGPLVGLLAAMPSALFAVGAAAATVKLAFSGLGPALKGTKGALEKLQPAQKQFVLFLKSLSPLKKELQEIAASNLLPGITKGMKAAFNVRNVGAIKSIIGSTAKVLGNLATQLGQEFSHPAWAARLQTINKTSTYSFKKLGSAVIDSLGGFVDLINAAQPLVKWLAAITAKGIRLAGVWAENSAKSGKANKFFNETKAIVKVLGSIFGHLIKALIDVGKAAYPLGKGILFNLNKELTKLSDWTGSKKGQKSLSEYFKSTKPVLHAVWRLAGGIAKAFFSVGQSANKSGLADFINRITDEVLPILTKTIAGSSGLVKPMEDLAINLAKVLASLAGSSGPMVLFVKMLAKAAGFIARLLTHNPELAEFVVDFLAFRTITKLLNLEGVIKSLWKMGAALVAQTAATEGATGAQWSLNAALEANPVGLIVLALVALAAGLFVAWRHSETFRNIVKGALDVVKGAAMAVYDFFRDHWKLIATLMAGPFIIVVALATNLFGIRSAIVGAAQAVIGFFRKNWRVIATVISGPFLPLVALATNAFGIRSALLGALTAMKTFVGNSAKAIAGYFRDVIMHDVNLFINALKWLRDTGGTAVTAFANSVKKPFDHIKDGVSDVWDKLKHVWDFFKWIIDKADLLGKTLGKVGGFFSGLASHVPGTGDVGNAKMMLGRAAVGGGGGKGPRDINPSLYDELALAKSFGLQLTSGYRPGAITKHGTPSDHGVYPSKAIDVSDGVNTKAEHSFFLSLIGDKGVKQAFFDPLGSIFGGVWNSYREGGHSDHVHVATYAKGGVIRPGDFGIVGEAGLELVQAGSQGATVTPLGGGSGRFKLVIDNWHEGTGYIEEISSMAAARMHGIDTRRARMKA